MYSVDKVDQELARALRAAQKLPNGAAATPAPVVIASITSSDLKSARWHSSLSAAGVLSTLAIALLLDVRGGNIDPC